MAYKINPITGKLDFYLLGADWNTNVSNKPTLGTAAAKNIPATGDASATEVVYGSDTRLYNARTPSSTLAHAASHISTGTDAIAAVVAAGASGLMTGADKTKLDGIASGANVGVVPNGAITGATKTKVTYDAKGLVTSGADATTADIADSSDKRYCTDAQKTIIGNTSGTNSGNQSGGTPAVTLGSAAAAGASANFLRVDDTIIAFDATAPSTQAFGDAAAVGAATVAARRDHKHAMMANPVSGTNTGDVTLAATNHGLGLTNQVITLGTPSTITTATTNAVVTTSHTHAITPAIGMIGNGSAQNQVPVTGATPFAPVYTAATGSGSPVFGTMPTITGSKFGGVNRFACAVVTGTGAQTLSGADMAASKIFELTETTARTFTLDTGTNLSTAVPGVQAGDAIRFIVKCSGTGSGAITMAGASGTTLSSTAVIAIGTSRVFTAVNTGANAWTIY